MSTAPSNDPNARSVPPDPGGRSRYLIRGIAIACVVLAVIAVFLMITLHQNAPPPKPQQQPGANGNGNSSISLPASGNTVALSTGAVLGAKPLQFLEG